MPIQLVVPAKERKLIAMDAELYTLVKAYATKHRLKLIEAAYLLIGQSIAKDLGADPESVQLPDKKV